MFINHNHLKHNNLIFYNGNDYNYCVGYGVYSNIYVEKCAFISEIARNNALKDYSGDKDFNVKVVDCLGMDNSELSRGNCIQFVPTYDYSTFDANMVDSILRKSDYGAGATLRITL